MQQLQLFAWQAAARGNDVHLNANPTQGELLHYDFRQKKEELKDQMKGSILAKYGGAKYLDSAPKELRQGQTENYVEYSRAGQVVRGLEKAKAKSKYPEDGKVTYVEALSIHVDLFLQSILTTTPLSGVLGMIYQVVYGAMHVAIPLSTSRIVLAMLERTQSNHQAPNTYSHHRQLL